MADVETEAQPTFQKAKSSSSSSQSSKETDNESKSDDGKKCYECCRCERKTLFCWWGLIYVGIWLGAQIPQLQDKLKLDRHPDVYYASWRIIFVPTIMGVISLVDIALMYLRSKHYFFIFSAVCIFSTLMMGALQVSFQLISWEWLFIVSPGMTASLMGIIYTAIFLTCDKRPSHHPSRTNSQMKFKNPKTKRN